MEPDDLLDFSIRTEHGHGRLRVRGLGHVDTEFIALRYLPLWPVQSEVVVTTSVGPMARALPRLVLRSVVLAYVRRWVGLVIPFALTLNIATLASRWPYEPWVALVLAAPVTIFALSWWPWGTAPLARARRICAAVDIPQHRVDLAHGAIDASVASEAEAEWRRQREASAATQRADYEAKRAAYRRSRREGPRGRSPRR